ncbi:MAG: protoporphyrinogen oxidase [Planctomycetota bacterium]|nr:MAG: protoporphyrinogen oxidase [Planctomycetota bacterium]
MQHPQHKVIIVGGGIGGLSCAWRLRQALGDDAAITVLEAAATPGGVTRSEYDSQHQTLMELGPDSMLSIKPAGLQLVRDLGLEEQLIGTRPSARRSCIARGRRLIPVPEGVYLMAPGRMLPFAASPLLSWPGKLRMGLDLLLPRRSPSHPGEESLAAFVRRRLGREALERLAQPLIGGIYTADPERLSLAATMPQFMEMEASHRSLILAMRQRSRQQAAAASGPRYGLFVTLRDGLGTLTRVLSERLADCLQCGMPVQRVTPNPTGGWQVHTGDGQCLTTEHVVLAVPAHVAASLLPAEDVVTRLLAGVRYADIATVNLLFDADAIANHPEAAGFVVPAVDHQTMIACSFVHHKYDHRVPPGKCLLRAFCGGAMHPEDLACSDAQLRSRVLGELNWRFGLRQDPEHVLITRWPQAMAQYEVGHLRRRDLVRQGLQRRPGLHLVGNGLFGVGVPDVIAQADSCAASIAGT